MYSGSRFPLPSWPSAFQPQQKTPSPLAIPQVKFPPAETATWDHGKLGGVY